MGPQLTWPLGGSSTDMAVGASTDMAVGASTDMAVGASTDMALGASTDLATDLAVGASTGLVKLINAEINLCTFLRKVRTGRESLLSIWPSPVVM